MKILNGLHLDYVIVEFVDFERSTAPTASDPVIRRMAKSWPDYACSKVVHLDDIPQEVIDRYVRENSH